MITHQVVFWLAPDLVPPGQFLIVSQRLARYIHDLNLVFAPCHRRFAIVDIRVGFGSFSHPQFAYKLLPVVHLHLTKMPAGSENSGSGTAGYDESGDFRVLQGWLKVWSPADNERDYKFQLYVLTHELGHCFGLALGEMYDMRFAYDPLPPSWGATCHLDWTDPADSLWGRHKDWLRDPMVSQNLQWSEYHRRVIMAGCYRLINPPVPMANTQRCQLRVFNAFGQPLENVGVELCRRDSPEFDASTRTNIYGLTWFAYDSVSSMALMNDLKLLVIQHPGGIFKRWISAYEAQERAVLCGDQAFWNLGTIVVPYPEGVTPVVIPDEDRLPAPEPPPARPVSQPLPKPDQPPKTGAVTSSPSPAVRPQLRPPPPPTER